MRIFKKNYYIKTSTGEIRLYDDPIDNSRRWQFYYAGYLKISRLAVLFLYFKSIYDKKFN